MDSFYDFNYEDYNYTNNHSEEPPTPHQLSVMDWFDISMYITVFLLGVPGNGLVVWVTSFEMKRTVNSVWFLNLAVADLVCCASVPFTIMIIALGHWPLGLFACKMIPSLLLVNWHATNFLLTMISIDHCSLVIKPVWCQNKRTVKNAYVACLIIWILAFLLSSPSFVFYTITMGMDGKEVCVFDYFIPGDHEYKVEILIVTVTLLMGFIIPYVTITACFSVLLRAVKSRFSESTRTSKVILIVIVGFFLCRFPYDMAACLEAVLSFTSTVFLLTCKVYNILAVIAVIKSCINPIIYVLMGRDFKSKFKNSLCLNIKKALEEPMNETPEHKKASSETKNTDSTV